MSRQFLVDGYNVMKQMPELCDRVLEDGRAGLVRFIRERRPHGSARNGMTVVFDGQDGIVSSGFSMDPEVRVIFTKGTSADDHIRDAVEGAADPRRIVCVTDDRDLAIACRHRGAEIWGVAQFVARGYKEATSRVWVTEVRQDAADAKRISDRDRNRIDQEFSRLWLKKP